MANTNRDPVCGMEVDPESAEGRSQYQGQTYYFCCKDCKDTFDRNPQQYAEQGRSAGRSS